MYSFQRSRSLGEQVKEKIVKLIVTGQIKPGDRLKEVEIAEKMGISRIPVRDALLLLQKEGFIDAGPHKSSIVKEIDREELIRVLLPIRCTIESYAMEKFLEIAGEEHFTFLDYQINAMSWAHENGNLEHFVEADILFHECILEATGLGSLISVWSGIANRMRMYFYDSAKTKKDNLVDVIQDHKELLNCMKQRDKAAAIEKIVAHINEIVI